MADKPTTARGRAPKSIGRTALRVLKMLRKFYPVMLPTVAVCILVQCVVYQRSFCHSATSQPHTRQKIPNYYAARALIR